MRYIRPSDVLSRLTRENIYQLLTDAADGPVSPSDVDAALSALGPEGGAADLTPVQQVLAERIERAVSWAEGYFDSMVGARYAVPVRGADGSVGEEVRDAVLTLVRYKIYSRRDLGMPEGVRESFKDVVEWLQKVQQGYAVLQLAGQGQQQSPTPIYFSGPADRTGVLFATHIP